jgi:thiamine biosynthesis lipoprotein
MGTVVTFDLYNGDQVAPGGLHVQIARAAALLRRADALFSPWKEHSPISQIRRGEISPEDAPAEVAEVLNSCAEARNLSDGWFDPWSMPGGLDPTGYVKGWAAQRALRVLVAAGPTGAIVNAAGDVATYGTPEADLPFRIGIIDPHSPHRLACVVETVGSIATSGIYERGAHLIDPHTGERCSRVASASVTGADLGIADALATALAVAGVDGLSFIERLDDYEGFVICWDGSRHSTDSFPFAPLTPPLTPLSAPGARA